MIKKRDKLQVIYDVLRVISVKDGKIGPTHIMYKANLSYKMMQGYLAELIEKNFVRETKANNGKTYSIESKGIEFLQKYSKMIDFLESFGIK